MTKNSIYSLYLEKVTKVYLEITKPLEIKILVN